MWPWLLQWASEVTWPIIDQHSYVPEWYVLNSLGEAILPSFTRHSHIPKSNKRKKGRPVTEFNTSSHYSDFLWHEVSNELLRHKCRAMLDVLESKPNEWQTLHVEGVLSKRGSQ